MAKKIGAVGPIARGSGLRVDIRKNLPYAAYEDVDWDMVTESGGDCFARMQGSDAGGSHVPAHL